MHQPAWTVKIGVSMRVFSALRPVEDIENMAYHGLQHAAPCDRTVEKASRAPSGSLLDLAASSTNISCGPRWMIQNGRPKWRTQGLRCRCVAGCGRTAAHRGLCDRDPQTWRIPPETFARSPKKWIVTEIIQILSTPQRTSGRYGIQSATTSPFLRRAKTMHTPTDPRSPCGLHLCKKSFWRASSLINLGKNHLSSEEDFMEALRRALATLKKSEWNRICSAQSPQKIKPSHAHPTPPDTSRQ